jgi:3-methyladenine DNA glycosylase AlkC
MEKIDNKQMWEAVMQLITEWSKQDPDNFEHLSSLCTVIQVALERQGFSVNKDYEIVTPEQQDPSSLMQDLDKPVDPEIQQIVDEHFHEMLDDDSENEKNSKGIDADELWHKYFDSLTHPISIETYYSVFKKGVEYTLKTINGK